MRRQIKTVHRNRRLTAPLAQANLARRGSTALTPWPNERVETGYLHSHARRWFASISIFTLR